MRFFLNGKLASVTAPPMKRLLDVLREDCRLTGTKEGCGEGECGACTVLIDGRAVNACLVPFAQVRGARVTTIEGLKGKAALQQAFVTEGGAQCGICTPGFIVAASTLRWHRAFLARALTRAALCASADEIRAALAGNLCRCTGYSAIYRAVERGVVGRDFSRAKAGLPATARGPGKSGPTKKIRRRGRLEPARRKRR